MDVLRSFFVFVSFPWKNEEGRRAAGWRGEPSKAGALTFIPSVVSSLFPLSERFDFFSLDVENRQQKWNLQENPSRAHILTPGRYGVSEPSGAQRRS